MRKRNSSVVRTTGSTRTPRLESMLSEREMERCVGCCFWRWWQNAVGNGKAFYMIPICGSDSKECNPVLLRYDI